MAGEQIKEQPFAELIPEFYKTDRTMLRIVGVFEQFYLQNEQRIDSLPDTLYEPDSVPDGFLNFLGGLVGLRNENDLFLPAQMRALIPAACRIQRKKGTRQALLELLRVYLENLCGHPAEPVIVEYEDWQAAGMPERIAAAYPELYRSESDFVVLFPPEPVLQEPGEQARLEQLVSLYCPAVCGAYVVVLKPGDGLDGLTYLDINTYL